jgi:4-hydroxybenzoate polyprenyltransferase
VGAHDIKFKVYIKMQIRDIVSKIFQLVTLLRPYSWTKNLFIFAPLFFAKEFFNYSKLTTVTSSFIVFCITASLVYILNDILDREQDKKHKIKSSRPIASGKVSIKSAIVLFFTLSVVDIYLIFFLTPKIAWLLGGYFILNILYSIYLKHIAVLDILIVSSFYFIRVMVGGVAANVFVSHWLLLCIVFISLFLIVGKRLAELDQDNKRIVLGKYSPEFLNTILVVFATLTITSYSLYSVLVLDSNLAIFSIFPVLLGIIRYLFIVFTSQRAEYPEKEIFTDKTIFFSGIAWVIVMYFIFYLHA